MFYRLANVLCRALVWLISRPEVIGLENIPKNGPFLLMANHISWLDPPVLGSYLPRSVTFMAKEELFKNWFLRWVVVNYGAFSIRRGEGDRQALRQALKVLNDGGVLGMFPEGTRSRDGRLQPGQPGAALLALKSQAPVVPVGMIGTDKVWHLVNVIKRPPLTLVVGRPFKLSPSDGTSREALAIASDEMMLRLAELLPLERRGAYRERAASQAQPDYGNANRVVGS